MRACHDRTAPASARDLAAQSMVSAGPSAHGPAAANPDSSQPDLPGGGTQHSACGHRPFHCARRARAISHTQLGSDRVAGYDELQLLSLAAAIPESRIDNLVDSVPAEPHSGTSLCEPVVLRGGAAIPRIARASQSAR